MNKFDVFLPFDTISKNESSKGGTITISGYASTGHRDYQGESIDPKGLNIEYLMSSGYIDYEHDTEQIIGVPTKNTYIDSNGLFLEADLFTNMEQVQDIMKLYNNIKDNGIDRNIGFSIEGSVNERDENDETVIRSVMITGVAVTTHPANPEAQWEVVSKSLFSKDSESIKKDDGGVLTAGYDIDASTVKDGAAFKIESMEHNIALLAQSLKNAKALGLETVATSLAEQLEKNDADEDAKVIFLQVFMGLSQEDASTIVTAIKQSNETNNKLKNLLDVIG